MRWWCSKAGASPHADRANDVSVVLDLIHDIDALELAGAPVVGFAGRRPSSDGPIDYVTATLISPMVWRPASRQQDEPPQEPAHGPLPRQPGGGGLPQPPASTGAPESIPPLGALLYRHDGFIEEVSISHRAALAELEHPAMRAWCSQTRRRWPAGLKGLQLADLMSRPLSSRSRASASTCCRFAGCAVDQLMQRLNAKLAAAEWVGGKPSQAAALWEP